MAYKGTVIQTNSMDILNALQKRLQTQGFQISDAQLTTLTLDVMNVINTDSATITAQAATELTHNKVRPFVQGV